MEWVATLILLIAALVYVWPEIEGMATTSLWQDELYTINRFSSKGLGFVLTHYNANNHIFFNSISSLTLGDDPYQPLAARLWSFICVALTVGIALLYYGLARRPFDAGAQLFFFLANMPTLDLALQARGYGFLAFAAFLCMILTWQYFRRASLTSLLGLPVVVWLATWTVPTFVFFGGGLLIVLFAYTRDWRWLLAGIAALLAIILSYWPIYRSLLLGLNSYSKDWGKQFANWDAISDFFSTHVLFRAPNWITFLVAIYLVMMMCRGGRRSAKNKASLCAGWAILFTLFVCLVMKTPPQRTIAYLAGPVAFILVTLSTELFRAGAWRKLRAPFMIAVAVASLTLASHWRQSFHFRPIESWLATAHRVERRFPKGTEVVAQFRPQWLRVYLSPDYPIVPKFDLKKFRSGQQIVVDSSFWTKSRFPLKVLPAAYGVETVPQRRGAQMQSIYFSRASTSPR